MSGAYYSDFWLVTQKDMEKLLHLDDMAQSVKSPKPKDQALKTILPLYLKYRALVRRLITCHDQIIQSQKRELVRKVLDCAIGRMLEYNREIVGLESNDNQWPDDLMIKMKMTPDDVTIPVPRSYVANRNAFLQQRRAYIENLINKVTEVPNSSAQQHSDKPQQMDLTPSISRKESDARPSLIRPKRRLKTVESVKTEIHVESAVEKMEREARETARKNFIDALLMIQSHERARAARCIGARVERDYYYNNQLALGKLEPRKIEKKIKDKAVTSIQRYWRGFTARKMLKLRINRMDELIDMTIPSWKDKSAFQRDKDNYYHRMTFQPQALKSLEETTTKERAKVFRIKGPGLMEDITDEIREWFLLWYNKLGYFDVYPVAEVGGTILVATGQTFTPEEYLIHKWEKESKKGEKKKKESDVEQAPKEKKEKGKKKLKGSEEEMGWIMPDESKALQGLKLAEDEFVNKWSLKDESGNDTEREYIDQIDEQMCYELQLEMREIVDEMMRLELAKLNEALIKDHAGDEEKFVIPTMEKGKKSKKKGKKKRGKKDQLADVSMEKIFNELVLAKIIHNYPEEYLENWEGDLSYQNYEAQHELRDYKHRIGEIRENIMNYCVLPLGSREVHLMAPLVRSVCICGLPRYGKSFLANAICNEVGALLFDLTPRVLVGLYEGKKNQEKLMNMIGKLAREYAPAIVFIDGGEKPWMKKIPITDKYEQPKRLAKLLPKFVKSIKAGDRVLFLTLATEPQKASKPFLKIHDKFLIIPITDYNTVYMFYKNLLMKYHGIDRNFNVSCLAKMSVGYPLEFIGQVVEKVMNLRRRFTLRFRPLDSQEILDELLSYESPPPKIVEQFGKFENRTPLGKTRVKILNEMRETRDNPPQLKKMMKIRK